MIQVAPFPPLPILPLGLDLRRIAIHCVAQGYVPTLEDPLFSNRCPALDVLCKRWGIPLGSYWCAVIAADIRQRTGTAFPPIDDAKGWHPAKAETWRQWALETGRFQSDWSKVQIGDVTIYGANGRSPADHIGASVAGIVRDQGRTLLWDFEGNTSGDPTFTRNGELFTCKPVDPMRVLGFATLDPISLTA